MSPLNLFLFVVRRLSEPGGIYRLFYEIRSTVHKSGVGGLLHELFTLAKTPQRSLSANVAYRDWISRYETQVPMREGGGRETLMIVNAVTWSLDEIINLGISISNFADPDLSVIFFTSPGNSQSDYDLQRQSEEWTGRHRFIEANKLDHFRSKVLSALNNTERSWIIFVSRPGAFASHSLAVFRLWQETYPQASFFYTDEDRVEAHGQRIDPIFKPEWDPVLFTAFNYVGGLICINRDLLIGEIQSDIFQAEAWDAELILTIARQYPARSPYRIPQVLYHRTHSTLFTDGIEISSEVARKAHAEVIANTFRKVGQCAWVTEGAMKTTRVLWPSDWTEPSLSVIIPTRDRLDLLERAVEGILKHTDYNNLELIIVDNDSQEGKTVEYFQKLSKEDNAKILRVPGEFNYSKFNNMAAEIAKGEILLLLNNDIEVLDAHWLREMAFRASHPTTGAVGAKLLYSNNRVQHAGVLMGVNGTAGHAFRYMPAEQLGSLGRLQIPHQIMAVTAACLAVSREKYFEVSGLDADDLKISYNDVDFCLKLHDAGYRNIITPYAQLLHHESLSRKKPSTPEQRAQEKHEVNHLRSKWSHYIQNDVFYSPNLTRISEDYTIAE